MYALIAAIPILVTIVLMVALNWPAKKSSASCLANYQF